MGNHFLIQIASLLCLTSVYVLQVIGGLYQDYQIYNIHVFNSCLNTCIHLYLVYSKYDKLQISTQTN
jgi:hypothetical protein